MLAAHIRPLPKGGTPSSYTKHYSKGIQHRTANTTTLSKRTSLVQTKQNHPNSVLEGKSIRGFSSRLNFDKTNLFGAWKKYQSEVLFRYNKNFNYVPALDLAIHWSKRPTGWGHFPPPPKPPGQQNSNPNSENRNNSDDKDSDKKDENDSNSPSRSNYMALGTLLAIALLILLILADEWNPLVKTVEWQYFQNELLAQRKVKKIVVVGDRVLIFLSSEENPEFQMKLGDVAHFEEKLEELQEVLGFAPEEMIPVIYKRAALLTPAIDSALVTTLSFILPAAILYMVFRRTSNLQKGKGGGGGIRSLFAKSNVKVFNKTNKVTTTFADVAGLPEAKQEIMEFIEFLKNPKKYQELGAKIPKGALLIGPPGTGKTLLAKAAAGEASVPFYSTSGSDFIELYVGVGPARVRDLFEQARQNSPCIVFIDEIDAIGRARGKSEHGGNDERENTLNQLLVEMDGFSSTTGVVVLAGTNRPDILDKALMRAGRFDRQVAIDNPDIKSREEIFLVHLKPIKMDKQMIPEFAKKLAALTPGFSGADIANTCNEAALITARRNGTEVGFKDFENAIDRVIGGAEKKNKVLSPKEKLTVAFHEAGHAVAGWFLEHATPVLKVSIVPRGQALGFSQHLPTEQFLRTQEQLNDMMVVTLGGRTAEELTFGSITTGASDDFQKVTKLAYAQVTKYGMNPKIGPLSFRKDEGGLKPYSEQTAELMDTEARNLINNAKTRCEELLKEKKDGLKTIANMLMEKEVISHSDLVTALGERPWKDTSVTSNYWKDEPLAKSNYIYEHYFKKL